MATLGGTQSTEAQQRRIDPLLLEEYCKNFTHGNPSALEFYSPMYPKDYPSDITCFRTITADFGYFVRIDFRDAFRIEPPSNEGNCDYDYLVSMLQNIFPSSLTTRPDKLEGFSLETLSSQVLEFEGKARANPIGVPFRCFLLGSAPGVSSKC